MQRGIFDYIEGEDEPDMEIGKAVRNATYHMIKPKLPECRRKVYEVILMHPEGITRRGIADVLGWRDRSSVCGRVKELLDAHLVKMDGIKYEPNHDGNTYANTLVKPI